MKKDDIDEEIVECVGLWLAEGNTKETRELTFTNNSFDLIALFNNTIRRRFDTNKLNIRIYVYTPDGICPKLDIERVNLRYYLDKRANKPYFIWRMCSVSVFNDWKKLVDQVMNNKTTYPALLRGFFAGEGNIKTGAHSNRTIRIAQKNRLPWLDNLLLSYKISFSFSKRERAYIIVGRDNWDVFATLKIPDLHPIKRKRFYEVYYSFKQTHYPKNFIRDNIMVSIKKPKTSKELAAGFNRSQARIQDILIDLKKSNLVLYFRVGSKSYWTSDPNLIVISERKFQILSFIDSPKRTYEIAKHLNISWKAAYKRMLELKKLGLVELESNVWGPISQTKKILIL